MACHSAHVTTGPQVDASTVDAATLYASNRFTVPDFQRDYSWSVQSEVGAFWQDLSRALSEDREYFLGLLVTTQLSGEREVVDGQQRLITLSLLANALRLIAIEHDRQLVAKDLRSTFLYAVDYKTESEVPRMHLTEDADRSAFAAIVSAATATTVPRQEDSRIWLAHNYLLSQLRSGLEKSQNPRLQIGLWAEFLTARLTFAVFDHPDRAAAFRVYEVVNTRGKALTPAELIKSYIIGNSSDRQNAYTRWQAIDNQLREVDADDQLTMFVRHVVTLQHGYVIPRELYQVVTQAYKQSSGVSTLLAELERHLPVYIQMIDPGADYESPIEKTKVFRVLSTLAAARFRPLVLATHDDPQNLERVARSLIVGLLTNVFGTGSIEAQAARAARRLYQGEESTEAVIGQLEALLPTKEEFQLRFQRNVTKQQAQVARSALLSGDPIPNLLGYPHQIRPRNGQNWVEFSFEDYRECGATLGNWILIDTERRPQGTRTPDSVAEKMLRQAVEGERIPSVDLVDWSPEAVRAENHELGSSMLRLWYDCQ